MKKEDKIKKISYTLIIAIAIIFFWTGVWGLADIYLFPNNTLLSLWTSVAIGLIILITTESLVKRLV